MPWECQKLPFATGFTKASDVIPRQLSHATSGVAVSLIDLVLALIWLKASVVVIWKLLLRCWSLG